MKLFSWGDLEWLDGANFPHLLFHGSTSSHSAVIERYGWRCGQLPYSHEELQAVVDVLEQSGWSKKLGDSPDWSLHWMKVNLSRAKAGAKPCFTTRAETARIFATLPGGETIKNATPVLRRVLELCAYPEAPAALKAYEAFVRRFLSEFEEHWTAQPVIYVVRADPRVFADWCCRRNALLELHAYHPTNDEIHPDGDVPVSAIIGKCATVPDDNEFAIPFESLLRENLKAS